MKVGDRVVTTGGVHGVVREIGEQILVYFGTDRGQEFTHWVPLEELTFCTEPVFFGDREKKGKVWEGLGGKTEIPEDLGCGAICSDVAPGDVVGGTDTGGVAAPE